MQAIIITMPREINEPKKKGSTRSREGNGCVPLVKRFTHTSSRLRVEPFFFVWREIQMIKEWWSEVLTNLIIKTQIIINLMNDLQDVHFKNGQNYGHGPLVHRLFDFLTVPGLGLFFKFKRKKFLYVLKFNI